MPKCLSLLFFTFSFVSANIVSSPLSFKTLPVLAQTAGCGSGWSNTALKYLSPVGSRQFRIACDEHDACYDTLGKSKQECDRAFHNRMLRICARDHNTIFGRPLKIACNGRADAYYTGVLEGGQDKYDKAQKVAGQQGGSGISGGIVLRNQWGGKCLQTMGQDKDNGSTVNIWDCTGTSNQSWALSDRGELRNAWSGKCLQTMGQDKDNGSTVNIWDCTGTSNQLWR